MGFFSDEDIRIICEQLQQHVLKYDIKERETSLTCENHMTKYMQMYIVTRKIEGIAAESLKLYHYYLSDFVRTMQKEAGRREHHI